MPSGRQNSIHLFRFAGIDVFLHWSWFVVAVYELNGGFTKYSSPVWKVVEYLGLFGIVLLHEFGHALACRQVGGTADQIVLWPLGGVAYVNPPQRPGATLWSIAAGPLVNAVLIPVLYAIGTVSRSVGWADAAPNFHALIRALAFINVWLLIFNLLPVYPLDGGKILRSLLWFVLGRGRSLMVATALGLVGIAGLIILALWMQSVWIGVIGVFMLMNCWGGLTQARALLKFEKMPRRDGFACPGCKAAPPIGALWKCSNCQQPFDTFQSRAVCPHCSSQFPATQCMACGELRPMNDWMIGAVAPANL